MNSMTKTLPSPDCRCTYAQLILVLCNDGPLLAGAGTRCRLRLVALSSDRVR